LEKTLLRAVIEATGLSRRKAFEAIRAGRAAEDGEQAIDPSRPYGGGRLTLDGASIKAGAGGRVYLVMNKPANVITATSDDRGRQTVLDLVSEALRAPGLHPVGRLDRDTTGLLLLTNDGDLTYSLTHPKHEVEKEYWVASEGGLSEEAIDSLRHGVMLDGKPRPADVQRLRGQEPYDISITIREGRRRQVRRMLLAVGSSVRRLKRVREGQLRLGDLPEGAVRPLRSEELRLLGLPPPASRPGQTKARAERHR